MLQGATAIPEVRGRHYAMQTAHLRSRHHEPAVLIPEMRRERGARHAHKVSAGAPAEIVASDDFRDVAAGAT